MKKRERLFWIGIVCILLIVTTASGLNNWILAGDSNKSYEQLRLFNEIFNLLRTEYYDEEKVKACELAKEAELDYVKTSTGYKKGATVPDVKLMYKTVSPQLKVKASGGIRTLENALAMIKAGASRLGTSAGVTLMERYDKKFGC